MIYNTSIWDVLVPEGEQEEAGEHLSMCSRCLAFPIRQAVPAGLFGLNFAPGLHFS